MKILLLIVLMFKCVPILIGQSIKNMENLGLKQCFRECLREVRCRSVVYHKDLLTCEVHPYSSLSPPPDAIFVLKEDILPLQDLLGYCETKRCSSSQICVELSNGIPKCITNSCPMYLGQETKGYCSIQDTSVGITDATCRCFGGYNYKTGSASCLSNGQWRTSLKCLVLGWASKVVSYSQGSTQSTPVSQSSDVGSSELDKIVGLPDRSLFSLGLSDTTTIISVQFPMKLNISKISILGQGMILFDRITVKESLDWNIVTDSSVIWASNNYFKRTINTNGNYFTDQMNISMRLSDTVSYNGIDAVGMIGASPCPWSFKFSYDNALCMKYYPPNPSVSTNHNMTQACRNVHAGGALVKINSDGRKEVIAEYLRYIDNFVVVQGRCDPLPSGVLWLYDDGTEINSDYLPVISQEIYLYEQTLFLGVNATNGFSWQAINKTTIAESGYLCEIVF